MKAKKRKGRKHRPAWKIKKLLYKAIESAAKKGRHYAQDPKVQFVQKELLKQRYREEESALNRH